MPRCAFLTMADPAGYVIDDDLAHEPLRALGWEVENVPWSRPGVRWSGFDLVVVRSTWDYHHRPEAFLEVLEGIARAGTRIENPLPLMRWNLRKTYLRDLAARGVPIVPTSWRDGLSAADLPGLFDEFAADEIVLKPVLGANADGAFRLDRTAAARRAGELARYFGGRPCLAQPFLPSIVQTGEHSLFYFNGRLSHAVLKTPAAGDFRVQEEHGGVITAVEPGPSLEAAGGTVLAALDEVPLYARVDLAAGADSSSWLLMELELVEPSLYLRMEKGAPRRFARAVARRADSFAPRP